MHLRRALLLFAIVLGVAAIAASLAPPPDSTRTPTGREQAPPAPEQPPQAGTRPVGGGETVRIRIDASSASPERSVPVRRPAVVSVSVPRPGEVRIPSLGLVASATERAPAVFDLFLTGAGQHAVEFAPVDGEQKSIAVLVAEDG